MKKALLYSIFALSIASTTLTSCEDIFGGFLDKQPSNELTGEQVFSDWNLTVQFHLDTYNFLRHGAGRISTTWLDAATDLAETSYGNGVRTSFNIGNFYGGSGASELVDTWEHYYRGIRKCNMLLTRIEEVPQNPADSEDKYNRDKKNYIAEARFLRAYFYWELFLRYGPIPIVTEVLDPDGDLMSKYTIRPTTKEYVVDFILEELKSCEDDLLDYKTAWTSSSAGRIGQPMACALRSRIMLFMASPRYSSESGITWQQAANVAKEFIDNYGTNFALFNDKDATGATLGIENYTNALLRTAYQGSNKEVIFYRNDDKQNWGNIKNDTPVGEGGNGGLCPSQNLVDMYEMTDGKTKEESNLASGYNDAQPWSNRDPRLAATVLYQGAEWGSGSIDVRFGMRDNPRGNANSTPTGYYVRKYIPESILSVEHSGTAYRLWTIIRYAEIMMNYAEAMNEVNGPCDEVYSMLDQIRERAGISGSVANRTDLNTKDKMRNFIHKERTIEFVFEEHRVWDVRRWNVATEALSRDIYGVNVAENGAITRKVAQKRVFEDKMYLYPIPEGEYWKTNIENNPGW